MENYKFRVEFLEDAKQFLDELDEKAREKVFYNIWKASITNDSELFKKNFRMKSGSLEPSSVKRIIGYLLFGIKQPRKIQ